MAIELCHLKIAFKIFSFTIIIIFSLIFLYSSFNYFIFHLCLINVSQILLWYTKFIQSSIQIFKLFAYNEKTWEVANIEMSSCKPITYSLAYKVFLEMELSLKSLLNISIKLWVLLICVCLSLLWDSLLTNAQLCLLHNVNGLKTHSLKRLKRSSYAYINYYNNC